MKRLLSIVMAFVLAFGLTAAPISVQPALANPGTIYVSVIGDDSSGDGTAGNPFRTIQKGVNEAADGDSIMVAAGTYDENIKISTKPSIKILGEGAAVTTINGGGSGSVVTGNGMNANSRIEGFTITGGVAPSPGWGGGLYLESSATTIASCNITGNSATIGGGICISDQVGGNSLSPQVINCLITDNNATAMGGGIFFFGSKLSPTIMNSTIAGNTAGNGVYNILAKTTITNTIVYGNSGVDVTNNGGTVSPSYSLIGTGTDPKFVGSGDYHLQSDSPGIDAGTSTGAPGNDLDGVSRPQGGGVDIGAFEFLLAVVNYTLNLTIVGNGTVDLDPDQSTYTHGETVELTATADPGWSFAGWSDGLTGTESPRVITMNSDISATATFTKDKYTLTIAVVPSDGGTVNVIPAGTYHYGDVVQLTVAANAGWAFTGWTGDLSGSDNPATITMDGDKNVTATFTVATTPMAEFNVTHAKLDCKKKSDDGKVRVQGELALDLTHGDDVDISETVTVIIGPLNETITMVEEGKKGEKWEYKRPEDGDGILKTMSIDWKKGEFDFEMDKVDLSGFTRPVSVSLQIGNDIGQATVLTSKITEVTIDSKKKDNDGKVRVEGELGFGLVCGPYYSPTDDIVVRVGSLSWTLHQDDIEVKGKEGESWEYKPPKDSDTAFGHAKVDWKKGSFDFDLDGVDLSSLDLTQPVEISVTIEGKTICETVQLTQKGKKDAKWEYKS